MLHHWFRRPEDQSICIIAFSVDPPHIPTSGGFVRGWMNCGGYLISPMRDNYMSCRVTQLMSVDLMEMSPFMMNVIVRTEPTALHHLRTFVTQGVTDPK